MMQVVMEGEAFVAKCKFEERMIPKSAGCRWDPKKKRWWTADPDVAAKLRNYLDAQAAAVIKARQQAQQDSLEKSRATDANLTIPAPEGLDYMPFQKAGVAYALAKQNVLIADEMGLGKTIQAIGIINSEEIKSVLVICPASLKLNWQRELRKWLVRKLSIMIANGGGRLPETDIVILNYDILHKHHDTLRAKTWDLMICDESHYCKNPKAQRTQEVLGAKDVDPIWAKRKVFLTGTPILNRPVEIYPIAKALAPKDFGSWWKFVHRYCDARQTRWGLEVGGASNLDELQDKLRSLFMVRRLKKDVLTELPAKRRQVIELVAIDAGEVLLKEQQAWKENEDRLADLQAKVELAKAEDEEAYREAVRALRQGSMVAFNEMSKVRHEVALAKVPAVIDYLKDVLESIDKLVLFAHHKDVIAEIKEAFPSSVVLTGDTSMQDRQAAVDRFQNDPACQLFIGSITAAGVGLTLTAASNVVFAELDWVPGNVTQAEDRCHRIGQTDSVFVRHLVLDGSLDAEMAMRLVEKQEMIDKALDREHERVEQEVVPVVEVATKSASRKQIEQEALNITDQEVREVHAKLRILASVCDGARDLDGMGFNRFDAPIGRDLASRMFLTKKQAVLGRKILKKYKRQLGE